MYFITTAIVLILLVLFLLYLFLTLPNFSGKQKAPFLVKKNIAHRGLHNIDCGVPENSLLAADLAKEHGYPIELDIRLTKDRELVVFHDDTLNRVTKKTGKVSNFTLSEIKDINLYDTDEKIPSFTDFLSLVNGKVPLIIEFKSGEDDNILCEKALEELKNYKGNFVIKSFHPQILQWFKKNAPNVVRGQLSGNLIKSHNNPIIGFLATHMVLNFLTRPHFISYQLTNSKNLAFRIAKTLGALTMVWTVQSNEDYEKAEKLGVDGIIFENITPSATFILLGDKKDNKDYKKIPVKAMEKDCSEK